MDRVPGLVSIIVTSYNREEYIKDCLRSLIAQTYKNIEVIIVDDCSTDRTIHMIDKFLEEEEFNDPDIKKRFIKVLLPRNMGYQGALTTGMFISKGEFIAIQDSDDLSDAQRIEKQVGYLKENKEYELVGTRYAGFSGETPDILEAPSKWIRYGEDIKRIYKGGGHCICHGTILFRGRVFDKLGGYTRKYGKAADYEFLKKCVLGNVKCNNIEDVLYYYRRHPQQMSKRK